VSTRNSHDYADPLRLASRPGHMLACRNTRLGLPVPRGYRYAVAYYLQRKHHQNYRPYQFHALGELGANSDADTRAAMVYGLYGPGFRVRPLDAAEQDTIESCEYRLASYCACYTDGIEHSECLDACRCMRLNAQPVSNRRARIARPASDLGAAQKLRESCMRSFVLRSFRDCVYVGIQPRRRSRLRLDLVSLRYLSHRRYMAKVCFAQGMQRLRPGIWCDPDGGIAYIQSGDTLTLCDYITRRAS